MTKRYFNAAIVYAILAMAGGVFYREFTKYLAFTGKTNLSLVHSHYFVLGMAFFLLLALLEKAFTFSANQGVKGWITVYHIGLNLTSICLFLRGFVQATQTTLSSGLNASLSGMSGIGHALLGVGMLALLFLIRKGAVKQNV